MTKMRFLSRKILLVEDDAVTGFAHSLMLRSDGYQVLLARTGDEALLHFARNPDVAIVLMDVNLGDGENGVTVASRILEQRFLPVIFLTSYQERELKLMAGDLPYFGYLLKDNVEAGLRRILFDTFKAIESTSGENATQFI